MKILLVAVNSKYIHSSLGLWYLKSNSGKWIENVEISQFSINDRIDNVISDIYEKKADVVAFSCYIWNIEIVLKLAGIIKQLSNKTKIVFGGPEVSFDSENLIKIHNFIDYILCGEGEVVFEEFLDSLENKSSDSKIKGLTSRMHHDSNYNLVPILDQIKSPYTKEMFFQSKGKLFYYEGSRGCPFSCKYCLSSIFKGVRYFSMERVKSDLKKIINNDVSIIKFVDRTFNCNKERVKELIDFIIKYNKKSLFHFEVAADLFDDEIIAELSKVPKGMIQFEIGIQSTNEEVLSLVNRKTDTKKVLKNVKKLIQLKNIHIHVDLIAGLPKEDLTSFEKSFNEVYNLKSHQFQLGFLKLLKGSKIRKESERYGYKYKQYPPYEVLYNNYLSYEELVIIKGIEELVERYYNSGKFLLSLEHIINNYFESPYKFYFNFYLFNIERGYLKKSMSSRSLYDILVEFIEECNILKNSFDILNQMLKFDYLVMDKSTNLPSKVYRNLEPDFKNKCFEFLKKKENVLNQLSRYKDISPKEIYKKVHFETFNINISDIIEKSRVNIIKNKEVIVFDYNKKDPISNKYDSKKVQL